MEELRSAQEAQTSADTVWLLGNDPVKWNEETEKK